MNLHFIDHPSFPTGRKEMSTVVKALAKFRNFRTLVLELGFDFRTGETHDWLVFNEKWLGEYQAPQNMGNKSINLAARSKIGS